MKKIFTIFVLLISAGCSSDKSNAEKLTFINDVCFQRIDSIRSLDRELIDVFLLKDQSQILTRLEADGFPVKGTTFPPPDECDLALHKITGNEIGVLIRSQTIWGATIYFYFENETLVAVVPAIIPQK